MVVFVLGVARSPTIARAGVQFPVGVLLTWLCVPKAVFTGGRLLAQSFLLVGWNLMLMLYKPPVPYTLRE